jgi:hypothetical protein
LKDLIENIKKQALNIKKQAAAKQHNNNHKQAN